MPTSASELLDFIESDVLRDVVTPRLVPRATLLKLLNEAYTKFARETHCFVCIEPLVLPNGLDKLRLPDECIHVYWVRDERGRRLADYTRRAHRLTTVTSSRITAYSTDVGHGEIEFYPKADGNVSLTMAYAHLPAQALTDSTSCYVELELDHAYILPEWVAWRALRNNDPDASETIDARQFKAEWDSRVLAAKAYYTRHAMGDDPSAQPRRWAT